MATQSADRKRCLSCQHWGGERSVGAAPDTVDYLEHNDRGTCNDGGWHGSSRCGPRNACGHWLKWIALEMPAAAPDTPPDDTAAP
jgi:hypothetical protein